MSVDVLAHVLSNIDLSSTDQDADLNALAEALDEALAEASSTTTAVAVAVAVAEPVALTAEPIHYVSGRKRPRSEFIPPLVSDLSIPELRLLKRGQFEDLLGELTYRQLLEFHKTRTGKGQRLRVWQYRLLRSCLDEA
uniref:Uncharacterized protein n=1 Tax=viral metagenome TaxID=1070528 RepID=A0A6C0DIX8_9ZZZZ